LKLNWFKKKKKAKSPEEMESDRDDQVNASIQGSNTDHHQDPLIVRHQLSPMSMVEAEAFVYVIDKMHEDYDAESFRDAVDMGLDQQWFYIGSQGELRVSTEVPE